MFFVTGTTVETSDLQNTPGTDKTTSALQFFFHILFYVIKFVIILDIWKLNFYCAFFLQSLGLKWFGWVMFCYHFDIIQSGVNAKQSEKFSSQYLMFKNYWSLSLR